MVKLKCYIICELIFIVILVGVNGHSIPKFGSDVCTSECVKKVAVSSNYIVRTESCARGCRFFDIAQFIYEGNSTRQACTTYCEESYRHNFVDLLACKSGCKVATPRFPLEVPIIAEISWSLLIDNGDISEQEDAIMDPVIREQLSKLTNVHIPEMKIKTFPLKKEKLVDGMGWWSGACRSVSRGVPQCLLGSLLLILVVLVLLLGLLLDETPDKNKLETCPVHHTCISSLEKLPIV